MYERYCNPLKTRSFFLFGARGTGKTTLLRSMFSIDECHWIDLLDQDLFSRLAKRPMELATILGGIAQNKKIKWIVIDEIQKIPELLDIVHQEIEKKRFYFALTGSSARKLKRGSANLLAGRALENFLFPLTAHELGPDFQLDFVLQYGSLPEVFELDEVTRIEYLKTYVNTYLKEEIMIEQLVRKLTPFRSFLEVAAQNSGKIINYSHTARDINSDAVSVKSYYQILEDTLIGFTLPSFSRSIRKQQRKAPKFYLFDLGIKRALEMMVGQPLLPSTSSYGVHFEHFVISEVNRLRFYLRKNWKLSYLMTKDDVEIDLIIERPGTSALLLEIKSRAQIHREDISTFFNIAKDFKNAQCYVVSKDPVEQKIEHVHCIHYQKFLDLLLV